MPQFTSNHVDYYQSEIGDLFQFKSISLWKGEIGQFCLQDWKETAKCVIRDYNVGAGHSLWNLAAWPAP